MTYSDDITTLWKDTIDKYVADQIGPKLALINSLQTALTNANNKVESLTVANAQLNDDLSVKSAQVISLTTQLQEAQTEIARLTALLNQNYDVKPGDSIQS